MICKRCGNNNDELFGIRNGDYYCKLCNKFNGKVARIAKKIKSKKVDAEINYSLSKSQKYISDSIVNSNSKDIYIDAVTGAGKT